MSRGTDIASTTLGTAAAAANAVPVFGQFASIGLGLAAGFTKLFGNIQGPRKKRRARRKAEHQALVGRQRGRQAQLASANMQGAGGQLNTGEVPPMPTTTLQAAPPPATSVHGGQPQTLNGNYNG